MDDRREIRPLGSILELGGIAYRLEAVEGCGSSAIVYRATYPDGLNRDSRHQVFLKELFPCSEEIRRGEDGTVVTTDAGREILTEAQRRFLLGNQINLELLEQMPASVAGNLNSYEAYGTYYSVLTVHGGENLRHRLERQPPLTLAEAAEILIKLLRALEGFHRRGLLHLDISPDNLILLSGQVLLIDFNSVWDTRREDASAFAFSCKAGYSAPELMLQNPLEIGPATDLFSCCAVFFHLLIGRQLGEAELQGGLRRAIATSEILREAPQTAAAKAAEVLVRGLHTLPRRRYQTVEAMEAAVEELINRLQGFGVTVEALWEVSAAQCRGLPRPDRAYLNQAVTGGGTIYARAWLRSKVEQGGLILLTGTGGMGKTRLLQELWRENTAHYRPGQPVYCYLSLRDYQTCSEAGDFLRQSLLASLRLSPQSPHILDARHTLQALLRSGSAGRVVLLLDGLNEAGPKREKLLQEIETLGAWEGVGILVTERSARLLDYALPGFLPLELSPLTAAQVEEQLRAKGLALPSSEKLLQLLTTPMLLFLYLESAASAGGALPESREALVERFLDDLLRRALRADSGSECRQLMSRYMLCHLLPAIAGEMARRGKTVLSAETARKLCRRDLRALRRSAFAAAFEQFRGKSRLMLEGIHGGDEWYDLTVAAGLIDRFGLLTITAQGQLALVHDDFLPVLSARARANAAAVRRGWWLASRRFVAAVVAAALLLGGAATSLTLRRLAKTTYTAEEQNVIYDALTTLNAALGLWSSQIAAQRQLLERASFSDVLDNEDAFARTSLAQAIEERRVFLDSLYAPTLNGGLLASLDSLAGKKALFSPALLDELCRRFQDQEQVAEAALAQLEAALCDGESVYNSRDKRERLVNAYIDYLQAETRYVSYLLATLLSQMTAAQQEEVLEAMTYMEALEGFYDGPGSVAPERLADGTARAREALKEAQWAMNAQGFSIEWVAEKED